MSAFDDILSGRKGHTISDVAAAIAADSRAVAEAFGRPSALTGMTTTGEQYKRLLRGLLAEAEGDSDLGDYIRGYQRAHRHEMAVNGDPDEIWEGANAMQEAHDRMCAHFSMAEADANRERVWIAAE